MRLIRTALAASVLGIAVLTVPVSPAMADARPVAVAPSPAPKPASPQEPTPVPSAAPAPPSEEGQAPAERPRTVPRGAPETGGGPSDTATVLVPAGAALLAAGAGMGVLALRRRSRAGA
ncbi:hypothetical protein IL992_17135 [Microbispora sp. NEAU-D428]|uniref:hypothetical protein n=1 Tax=Microbispora sitophila TaxID=2771537 RepID=UPI001867BEB9|nr:hypothetical protein [Microbispora sitophila]MBE3010901.1 hypothetical protein [Microbispora sitophila]